MLTNALVALPSLNEGGSATWSWPVPVSPGLYPALGVLRLRQLLPSVPRNSTVAYLRRLHWLMPGAVWAIDGTWLDRPVERRGRRALVVVEMHSRKNLALQSVSGERAVEAERVLASLIEQHAAPLVFELDNGSAFLSERVAAFCHRHGITLMHPPIRRPRCNGTCEVSGRWAKHRAMVAAAGRGDPGRLCQDVHLFHNHRIIYTVTGDHVEVVHIRRGTRKDLKGGQV